MLRQRLEDPHSLTVLQLSILYLNCPLKECLVKCSLRTRGVTLSIHEILETQVYELFAVTFNTLPQDNSSLNRIDYILT